MLARFRWFALSLLAAACSGSAPDADEGALSQSEAAQGLEDPNFVLRKRIVFGAAGETFHVQAEPFSHRARKWHAYPMTAYPDAKFAVSLRTKDPKMKGRAE